VVDLAVDPATSPSTVYAAVSSGGIMKSTDGGASWTPAWPASDTQAMGALARGPDGMLWADTGEANPSGGGDTFLGGWDANQSGLNVDPDLGRIGIAFAPSDPNRVYIEFTACA
jgi:hypothetical protein